MHHCQSRRNRTASPPLMKTHHRSLYSRSRQRRATRFHSLLKPNSFLGLFTSYFAREPLHGFVRAGLSDFVPEGLNDSSQAIYCLVSVRKRNRPVGNGMIGSDRRATIRTINQSGARDQTVPCRTDSRWNRFQAINCPATIIQSLRDKGPPRLFAPSPFRPFAVSLSTGRFPFLHRYQAINCLATIIQSLRDGSLFLHRYQAINCLATIIQSLRDEVRQHPTRLLCAQTL
jgi:hypothetical protein